MAYIGVAILSCVAGLILVWGSTLDLNPDQVVQLAALVVAALAFVVAIWQAYLQRKAMRLQIFENAFRDIRDREATFTERYVIPLTDLNARLHAAQDSNEIPDQIRVLGGIRHVTAFAFFNTIEYLAFLINNGFVGDCRLQNFFAPAIVFWYEELFRKHDPEAEQYAEQYYSKTGQGFTGFRKEVVGRRAVGIPANKGMHPAAQKPGGG